MTCNLTLAVSQDSLSESEHLSEGSGPETGNTKMKKWTMAGVLAALMAFSPTLFAQRGGGSDPTKADANFDPHDLNGSWIGTGRIYGDNNSVPEPPLTPWAKEHLLLKNISHAGLNATARGASSAGSLGTGVTSVDENGVPTNIPGGHYPGEKCELQGTPVAFNYINEYPMLFIMLPDRIYQMFEYHREWRTIWLNRDHPKDLLPSYFGDSVGKWDGNTLVVDTVGYNGEKGHRWISENVGHYMSDAFRLVERYHLTDATRLTLEMTYYDPKAWGDKPWTGWKKEFKLDSKTDSLQENVCDTARDYESVIAAPIGVIAVGDK